MTRTTRQRDHKWLSICPEEAVGRVQHRVGMFSLEHGDLLPQGKDLKGSVAPIVEEDADHGEKGKNEVDHEFTF